MRLIPVLQRILSVCEPAWRVLIGVLVLSVLLLFGSFAVLVHIGPNPHENLRLFHLAYDLAQLPVIFLFLGAITAACLEEQHIRK